MKQAFTTLFLFFLAFHLQAQITLELQDYTLQPGVTVKGWEMATTGLTPPEEGAGLTWDFSGQALTGPDDYIKLSANDPDLPDANLKEETFFLRFELALQPVTFIERLDESGYVVLGRKAEEVRVPTQSITGGPNDTITFLANTNIYEEPVNYFRLPLNYQGASGSDITLTVDFEVTVAAFGLDRTPAKQISYISHRDTVMGYGTLILPHPDGEGTVSMEVLMVRDNRVSIDSFFLAGQPAPQLMLDALSLTQGSVVRRTSYDFYGKGLPRSALSMSFDESGTPLRVSISDYIRNLVTSTSKVAADLLPTKVFPNPTTGSFQVAFEKSDARDWSFDLYNPLGQLTLQQRIGGSSGPAEATLHLDNRPPGMYHFLLRNGEGMVVGSGKLLVH